MWIPHNPPRDLLPVVFFSFFRSFVSLLPLTFHRIQQLAPGVLRFGVSTTGPPLPRSTLLFASEGCDLVHEFPRRMAFAVGRLPLEVPVKESSKTSPPFRLGVPSGSPVPRSTRLFTFQRAAIFHTCTLSSLKYFPPFFTMKSCSSFQLRVVLLRRAMLSFH